MAGEELYGYATGDVSYTGDTCDDRAVGISGTYTFTDIPVISGSFPGTASGTVSYVAGPTTGLNAEVSSSTGSFAINSASSSDYDPSEPTVAGSFMGGVDSGIVFCSASPGDDGQFQGFSLPYTATVQPPEGDSYQIAGTVNINATTGNSIDEVFS